MSEHLNREIEVPPDVRSGLARAADRLGMMGTRLHWLAIAESTNDVSARHAADGAPEGTTVVAEAQTHGRGRHGRSWFSPPGAGLYMSVVLRPAENPVNGPTHAGLVTMASGVAVAEAVRAISGLPAEIKWPNDVIVNGRKLAGILTEAAFEQGRLRHVVVGIGVNLAPAAYPPDLQQRATSIEAETNRAADRALLLVEILAALNVRYAHLCDGSFDVILSAWRRLAPNIQAALVEWEGEAGVVRGRVEDVASDGALLVRAGGALRRVVAGEVRVVSVRRSGVDAVGD